MKKQHHWTKNIFGHFMKQSFVPELGKREVFDI
jgi:hypothetical protein